MEQRELFVASPHDVKKELKTGTCEKPGRIGIVSKINKNMSFGDQAYLKSNHLNISMTLNKSLTFIKASDASSVK